MKDQKNECEQVVKAIECHRHNEEEDTCKYCKECPAGTWELAEEELTCIQSVYVRSVAIIKRQEDEIADLLEKYTEIAKRQFPSYCQACSEEEAIKIGREYGKTEVSREIFAEIEMCMSHDYIPTIDVYSCALKLRIAELKKKYTEAKSDE